MARTEWFDYLLPCYCRRFRQMGEKKTAKWTTETYYGVTPAATAPALPTKKTDYLPIRAKPVIDRDRRPKRSRCQPPPSAPGRTNDVRRISVTAAVSTSLAVIRNSVPVVMKVD
uniref:Uncharacterized protein n=1 Tax=Panagrellus redivivus TaxID=6233 RepID=A0A7E4VPF2_PANRE